MRITIPDQLAEEITSQLPASALLAPNAVEAEAIRLLTKTAAYAGRPFLVLHGGDLDRIGMAAGRTFPPQTVAQIVQYIERLASIRLGDIRLDFPAGQLEEISRLAAREEKTPEEYIGRIAATFLSNFFRLPAAAAEVPVVTKVEYVEGVPVADAAPTA